MHNQPDDGITPGDRELLTVISDKLTVVEGKIDALITAWQEYEPVVSAFRRGGLLAARTAARNGGRRDERV